VNGSLTLPAKEIGQYPEFDQEANRDELLPAIYPGIVLEMGTHH